MKKYWFIVTLISGVTFTQMGEGENRHQAFMDACISLNNSGIPEDDVVDVSLIKS